MFLLLFLIGLVTPVQSQADEDNALHFTNVQNGRAVWIVDESSLPWSGSYDYFSTEKGMPETVLMTIVDSSTGNILGECKTDQHGIWTRFQWVLEAGSLHCITSATNATRVEFTSSQAPRTFSVRIQAVIGPSCIRDVVVQNERPVGCPPRLSHNSFSSLHLQCGCPHDSESEEEHTDSTGPQFPILELNFTPPTPLTTDFAKSPCADYTCENNGKCVVSPAGLASCMCPNGFIGAKCEVDLCRDVPCQFGGVCRSNGAEAFCECAAGFTGVLCETPVCEPKCSNGECVVMEGTPRCECRQGFMGINCNVIDVCLGDAACAMFGDNAKCVVDPASYNINTPALINATYDCRCPHPTNGEFVDCLQLHLASLSGPTTIPEPVPSPAFPAVDFQGLPGFLPTSTTKKRILEEDLATTQPTLLPHIDSTVPILLPIHPNMPESTAQTILPTLPTSQVEEFTQSPNGHQINLTPTTFVFPQVFESTQTPFVDHQPTHSVLPTRPSPQPTLETVEPSRGFPTPAPISVEEEEEVEETEETDPPVRVENTFNNFPSFATSTLEPPTEATDAPVFETTPEEEETTPVDYEEESTEESSLEPSTSTVILTSPTTTSTTTTTTESTTEVTEATTEAPTTVITTLSTLPIWLVTTPSSKPPTPFVPLLISENQPAEPVEPNEQEDISEENTSTDNASNETTELEEIPQTTNSPDVHQQETGGSERQKSSAASWIVAIVALIVLGLLLMAASLFVLRYIKQSRKLHGKYNPAREEHALSAAYSMPMSHITKEERLI